MSPHNENSYLAFPSNKVIFLKFSKRRPSIPFAKILCWLGFCQSEYKSNVKQSNWLPLMLHYILLFKVLDQKLGSYMEMASESQMTTLPVVLLDDSIPEGAFVEDTDLTLLNGDFIPKDISSGNI
jgi:hypothetical protein